MTTQLTARVSKTIQEQQYEPLTVDLTITETCPKKKYNERLAELTDLLKEEVFAALGIGEGQAEGQEGQEGEEGFEEGNEGEEGFEEGQEGEEGFEEGNEGEEGFEEGNEGEEGFEEGQEDDEFGDLFDDDDPGGEPDAL